MKLPAGLPLRWLLIFWIFLMSSVAYLDRVNISIAGKSISEEFGLTHTQLGYVFSAFLLGYAFFQAPAGRVADRLGPRLVLMVSVVWWAFFTVAITLLPAGVPSVLFLLIGIRFSLGIGEAVMYPASNSFVSAWIPSSERGIANGFIFAGVGFGAGVTSPLITYLMIHYGWRSAFYVSALIGLAAGSIWFLLARNKPRQHPWITDTEASLIEAGLPAAARAEKSLSWLAILANRNVLALTFSYFSFGYVAQIFFNWFFIYLNEVRGLDLRQSSLYTMLPFIAMSVCSIVGGLLSDYLTRLYGRRLGRCGIAIFGIGFCAIFIVLGSQVSSPQLASVVLAGGAGSLYLAQSSFWSVSANIGGKSGRVALGRHEYGSAVRGRSDGLVDARDRGSVWLDRRILGGRRFSRDRRAGMVSGGRRAWGSRGGLCLERNAACFKPPGLPAGTCRKRQTLLQTPNPGLLQRILPRRSAHFETCSPILAIAATN